MNTHKNARLSFVRRQEIVRDIVETGMTPVAAAVMTQRNRLGSGCRCVGCRRRFHAQGLLRATVVVDGNPVADAAAGMQRLEPMAMRYPANGRGRATPSCRAVGGWTSICRLDCLVQRLYGRRGAVHRVHHGVACQAKACAFGSGTDAVGWNDLPCHVLDPMTSLRIPHCRLRHRMSRHSREQPPCQMTPAAMRRSG